MPNCGRDVSDGNDEGVDDEAGCSRPGRLHRRFAVLRGPAEIRLTRITPYLSVKGAADAILDMNFRSPQPIGGTPVTLHMYVEDCDKEDLSMEEIQRRAAMHKG